MNSEVPRIIEIAERYHPLTNLQAKKLSVVAERLTEQNKVQNLTALKTPEDIALLHFYDSLTLLDTGLFDSKTVIDVGCGGGFPSFPLAVCAKDCKIYANDSTAKKLTFVSETAKMAGIYNLFTLPGRAEELSRTEHRESFDIAVARGVAALNVLCELCLPLVKKGGCFIAMKGSKGRSELETSQNALKQLSGRVVSTKDYAIPETDRTHTLIIIQKTKITDNRYPRPYSQIIKKPL